MGSRYLTDLASVVRSAGLSVKEYSGWQTRARGSGGYDSGRPTHVMCHHTASGSSWDGQRDADYIAEGDEDAPLANLYLDRSGCVWVIAAGATNTNGKGCDTWGGGVPDNSMNSYALGIEAGNNGTTEQWPQAQQTAYTKLVRVLCQTYNISNNCVRGHFEWAPTRKIDPAGPSAWAQGSASWDMNSFRMDCVPSGPTPGPRPPIPPSGKEGKLYVILIQQGDPQGRTFLSDLTTKTYIPNPDALAALQFTLGANGLDNEVHEVLPEQMAGYGLLTAPVPGLDEYGAMT